MSIFELKFADDGWVLSAAGRTRAGLFLAALKACFDKSSLFDKEEDVIKAVVVHRPFI